jgi:hypothetical protein
MSETTTTLADRLHALTARHGGHWTRHKSPAGDVIRLHLDTGDVLAGAGPTTADAVAALEAKAATLTAAS